MGRCSAGGSGHDRRRGGWPGRLAPGNTFETGKMRERCWEGPTHAPDRVDVVHDQDERRCEEGERDGAQARDDAGEERAHGGQAEDEELELDDPPLVLELVPGGGRGQGRGEGEQGRVRGGRGESGRGWGGASERGDGREWTTDGKPSRLKLRIMLIYIYAAAVWRRRVGLRLEALV